MGKTRVEVCLISGRGLQGSSTALFWKTQWFAVGWIDPNDKYCTKMEAPRNGNPVWGTKFSTSIDNSQAATLQVEVYSRDPLFFREKLQGTATVVLREFLANPKGNEERGSYQLRKKNSDKARGFVDVSIRVLGEGGGKEAQQYHPFSTYPSFPAGDGVVMVVDDERDVALATSSTSRDDYMRQEYNNNRKGKGGPSPLPLAAHRVENHNHNYDWRAQPYSQPTPFPANFCNNSVGGPTYPAASAISNYLNIPSQPLMPLPPSLLPSGHNYHLPLSEYTGRRMTSYINIPSSSSSSGGRFGMGAGIGAVGAGAFLFGDEFASGAFELLGG